MASKEIIICIDNERVHFNPDLSISIYQTNIPKDHLTFRSNDKIYWKVEMLEYLSDRSLKVKVKDYYCYDQKSFSSQQPRKEISKLNFEKFDWEQLEPLLSFYQKGHLHEAGSIQVAKIPAKEHVPAARADRETIDIGKNLAKNTITKEITYNAPKTEYLSTEFTVKFTEVTFKLGYVMFSKRIKQLDESVDFKIINDNILPEFDHIKFWFSKILKTPKIRVTATITLLDKKIIETSAVSPEVGRITADIIDSVKIQRTFALLKAPKMVQPDKSLFTADEIFTQSENDKQGNTFRQSEYEILEMLINGGKIRNGKQLQYLSGAKQTDKNKLRYTLSPNFGFLFLIEGEKCNHFVWELLDSHATYIWSIGRSDQDILIQYKRIEAIINTVRLSGRDEYKRAYKNNHSDGDLVFISIEHSQASSNFKDGFPKWKSRINEVLI